jgi:serine/threonine protein kinase
MIGTELDGKYRIEAELGSGGAGTVYRALHLERQTKVAVKVLRAELASSVELRHRFAREARALTALAHPNIVSVVDSGVASDTAFLVMELLEGETLSARLKRGALSVTAALAIMRQLLSALGFVHEQQLVHRDVKPANIFLQAEADGDRVRLLDFGLAKFLAPEAGGPSLTRAGQIFGTPSYMAPEQIAGQQADPRTDVYAAGIVLFEMLAGRVPFQGDASDVLRRHIMDDLPLATAMPKGVPAGVIAVLRTATAKTRSGRFADAKEMRDELDRVAPAPGESVPPEPARSANADAYAPTLSIEQKQLERAKVEERVTAPDPVKVEELVPAPEPGPDAEQPAKSLGQRLMRFGTNVAILVSLTAAGLAAAAIYMLVTPGREEERRVIENALGLPSASASAAFHPKTLRSKEAWPSGSGKAAEPPSRAVRGESPPVEAPAEAPPGPSAGPPEPAAEVSATSPEPPPAPGASAEVVVAALEAKPKGSVPENPWASTPGELLRLMGRLNKTRGFDKRDMRDLHQYNGKHPTDPRGHILLARGYLTRKWVKDAASEYATALKISDSTRGDPRLLPDLIRTVQLGSEEATRLVVEVFGPAAGPAVDRALASQPRPEVKARLEKLRDTLGR